MAECNVVMSEHGMSRAWEFGTGVFVLNAFRSPVLRPDFVSKFLPVTPEQKKVRLMRLCKPGLVWRLSLNDDQ